MKGGMVNRPMKRVGANRRNSGADLNHHPPVANISGSNNSNFSRCGAVAAYKARYWTLQIDPVSENGYLFLFHLL